ncbi:MAG TPA: agmatine deiminase family protein [Saprospiraceae bacterium]|nr:agmatine deiminase family protein [Saprospiraceae bacterium]
MKHVVVLLLICCIAHQAVEAQVLPRGLSEQEKRMLDEGFFRPAFNVPGEFHSTRSPVDPPRAIAEWEEMQAIVITWAGYQSILKEIVRYAKEEVVVIIVTPNESSVRTYLESNDVDISENVEFINTDFNSVWVRDYGANPVYLRDVDSLLLVDWIYNRPRPKDDVIPYAVAAHLGVPIYGTVEAPLDLVNTGGNFMSDGLGRGFSSKLVLTENGPGNQYGTSNHDENAVDAIMQQFMGIDEYVKMTTLPYDGIHHIDMHMKMVDEGTLIVGQYPEGVADGPQIEANLQYVIENFKEATGRDYRTVRIQMPPDEFGRFPDDNGDYRTYANAMFINRTILVPTYEEKYDTTALRIWRETMPGYHVVGINCNSIIPAGGALHCVIKEVGVHRPLWITHHQPGEVSADEPLTLEAQIRHISGINTARIFYRISGSTQFDSLDMQFDADDIWSVTLPNPDTDVVYEYYFKARAQDGKVITRPLPAPEAFFRVNVEGTPTATDDLSGISSSMTVFPNPAGALTCVPVTSAKSASGVLMLYDLHGRLVKEIYSGIFPEGESTYFFDAGKIRPGYYIVELKSDKYQVCKAVMIK